MAEPLPFVTWEAVPLIVDDDLYIVGGYDGDNKFTCNTATASIYPGYYRAISKRLQVIRYKTNSLTCLTPQCQLITTKVV